MRTVSIRWCLTRSMPVSAAPRLVLLLVCWPIFAATHQVIVVTHLAQVAVMADKHYVVSKEPAMFPRRIWTR